MAIDSRYRMSQERLDTLKEELHYLETTREKEVAELIKEARSFGDLSENSEYDEAKNEQAMIESRILQIEAMLKNVKILDAGELDTEVVNVGSKVQVLDVEFDEEETFYIVGSTEANPDAGKISDESPVGKGLLGHRIGDIVAIPVPNGSVNYKILNIMM